MTQAKPSRRRVLEHTAATGSVVLAVGLAVGHARWPFGLPSAPRDSSIWQFLLSDPFTLGFVRLSLVLLSLFVIASVPALFAAGPWLKGFGTAGVVADEESTASAAVRDLADLRRQLDEVIAERNQLLQLLACTVEAEPPDPEGEKE